MTTIKQKIEEIFDVFMSGVPFMEARHEAYLIERATQAIQTLIDEQCKLAVTDIVRIGRERFDNDSTYSFDAWVEDCEEYLNRTSKESEQ